MGMILSILISAILLLLAILIVGIKRERKLTENMYKLADEDSNRIGKLRNRRRG